MSAASKPAASRRSALLGSLAVLPAAFIARRLWLHFDLSNRLFNRFDIHKFSLPGVEGVTRADGSAMPGFGNADLIGQVSILHGFGAWCPDCHEEHPFFLKFVRDNDLKVYGLDFLDSAPRAATYLGANGNPFHAIGFDPTGQATHGFGIRGVPSTLVLDKAGNIAHTVHGPLNAANGQELLKKMKALP